MDWGPRVCGLDCTGWNFFKELACFAAEGAPGQAKSPNFEHFCGMRFWVSFLAGR